MTFALFSETTSRRKGKFVKGTPFYADNNLTVAMSDPSDRHAVDEIAFFTGTYVVRAVATQMQIAWCLAHYYGHVTTLGQRLLVWAWFRISPHCAIGRPPRFAR